MILLETSIQLVPDGTLLLHLFLVVVMVFVLNRTLLKPINQILAEREKQIAAISKKPRQWRESRRSCKKYNDALREARATVTSSRKENALKV
jgi:F0F1-type ATP synthase membrane subunit b/b'